MNHLPCLTLRKNLARSVVVGSAPTRELENVNVLADKPIVKPCTAGRCKRSGEGGIRITLWRGVCRSAGHGSNLRNRYVCQRRCADFPGTSRNPSSECKERIFLGLWAKFCCDLCNSSFERIHLILSRLPAHFPLPSRNRRSRIRQARARLPCNWNFTNWSDGESICGCSGRSNRSGY